MPDEPSKAEQIGKRGAEYRQALIENMARVYGARPSNAQPLSHAEELRLWELPTSPAAVEALKMGGTLEEAREANRLWAQTMKDQANQMRQDGATEAQVHEAGLSDDAIFKTTRKHAYERGKANGKNDPAIEAEYHAKMAERAAKARATQMTYTDVPDQQPAPREEAVSGSEDRAIY